MEIINQKTMKKIENSINNGIRTIFVEGPADICLYKRFYENSEFKHFGSCDRIIEAVRKCNSELGKTPLVVGIIDRDDRTDEDEEVLLKDNIFMLKEREIESIFLRQDVITKLFGDTVFMQFAQEICREAMSRSNNETVNYQEALNILKKEVSSKYNIRVLLKIAKIKNKGNKENIELLSSMMDERKMWEIVRDIIPELPNMEKESVLDKRKSFQIGLQSFVPTVSDTKHMTIDSEHKSNSFEK